MRGLIRATAALFCFALGGVAAAQEEQASQTTAEPEPNPIAMPLNYVERPLTLPKRTLRVDAAPSDFGLMDSGTLLGPVNFLGSYGIRIGQVRSHSDAIGTSIDTTGTLGIGASYGVVDRLEVGVLLLPIAFERGNGFGNIAFYTRAALLAGEKAAIGLQASLSLPTNDDLGVGVGIPISLRLGTKLRLETGAEGEFSFDTEEDSGGRRISVGVPFALSAAIGRAGFLGGRTGGTMLDIGGRNDVHIPAGAIGGVSFAAGSFLVDIKGSATWTFVVDTNTSFNQSIWMLMLGANVHLGL